MWARVQFDRWSDEIGTIQERKKLEQLQVNNMDETEVNNETTNISEATFKALINFIFSTKFVYLHIL